MAPQQTTQTTTITGLDHVQVAIPRDGEARARAFYGDLLGLPEIPKPAALAGRGGVWYRCGDQMLHLGLEDDFRPQHKGHPALLTREVAGLRVRLEAAGVPTTADAALPGFARFYAADPFGNRLEFLQPVAMRSDTPAADDANETIKARVRGMFGRNAAGYVASPAHAAGSDLRRLVELAAPLPTDDALDISTGGGHTALALAPHVGRVVASDLTPRMLAAARDFITARGVANVAYVIADAERLPFLDEAFDLVTVRLAPHHYADVAAAMREVSRVLKPGGRFVMIDNIAPEDPALDALVNDWDTRRDPSHVREWTVAEWRALLAGAGLRITDLETEHKPYDFTAWTERMGMPAAEAAALEADILAVPEPARAYFAVVERDGRLLSWSAEYLIARAVK